jgi:magnesium chelatase family protein
MIARVTLEIALRKEFDYLIPPDMASQIEVGSREVAERVALARERQASRYAAIGLPHLRTNAAVSGAALEDVAGGKAGAWLAGEAAEALKRMQ